MVLILLLAVGLWTILWAEMGPWGGGILRLPLPTAARVGLYPELEPRQRDTVVEAIAQASRRERIDSPRRVA